MDDPQTMQRLVQYGRIIMADLLRHDKRDPSEFYTVILLYIKNIHWSKEYIPIKFLRVLGSSTYLEFGTNGHTEP